MRGWRTIRLMVVLAMTLPCLAVPPARRSYADPAHGVRFSYPSNWTLNGDDDAATAKLRITSDVDSNAVLTLEGAFADEGPYKDSDFEAAAFAYAVRDEESETTCFATVARDGNEMHRPVEGVWNGGRAVTLDIAYRVEAATDTHRMVATYRRGRCYLFESVIVSMSPDAASKPLSAARWAQLRGESDSVMQSVGIALIASVKAP